MREALGGKLLDGGMQGVHHFPKRSRSASPTSKAVDQGGVICRRYPVHVRRDCRPCLTDSRSSLESHTYPFVSIANVSGDELKLPIDCGRIFSVSGAPGS